MFNKGLRKNTKIGIAIVLIVLIGLYWKQIFGAGLWFFVGVLMSGNSNGSFFPTGSETLRGYYYRLSARYLVDSEEPLDFEVVVACGRGRSEIIDSKKGKIPGIVLKRTIENHAVLMRVPSFCDAASERTIGQANSNYDGSFLPFTVWFNSADTMELGVGYASIFAYENPSARLTFLGATVRYATREEFEDWMVHNRGKFIPAGILGSLPDQNSVRSSQDAVSAPQKCYGIGLTRMNLEGQRTLDQFRPSHSPEFWSNSQLKKEDRGKFRRELEFSKEIKFSSYDDRKRTYLGEGAQIDWINWGNDTGFSSLDRSKLSNYLSFRYYPSNFFPVFYNDALPLLETGNPDIKLTANIELKPQANGFVACYERQIEQRQSQSSRDFESLGKFNKDESLHLIVNDADEIELENTNKLDGYLAIKDREIGKIVTIMTGN
ncbi:hypothetical protein GFK91_29690 (plasmid) [Roseibium aggregatum]|uniref:hypothetical protein n=1 Tax=Roseibium aggregatum TaxID=187304 RepID=UPI001E63FA8C|nr:hypothetical protein [Roseibium aggregatum]UES59923.1 hypothetical protein GFK91_29690 [Roseibium aggregatum]